MLILDKNEEEKDTKLYCICQTRDDGDVDMIGCDAPDCRLEWFHFECIGLNSPPEGQWYCPECSKRYGIKNGKRKIKNVLKKPTTILHNAEELTVCHIFIKT